MADPISSGDRRTLEGQIATRARSWDSWSMSTWLPNPDPILKAMGRDISTYRDLRADAPIGGAIRRRKAAVQALEPRLDQRGAPARIAKAIESILSDLWATPDPDEPGAQPGLPALIAEAQNGALFGYQPLELTWGKVGSLLVPQVVQGKPPEWFHFDAESRLRFRARDTGVEGELLPARKFLLARQGADYANPYGFPDLSMCFWPNTFRRAAKFWAAWLEKYGGDFLLGKLPRAAPAKDYDDLVERLDAMLGDSVAAIPDDGSVERLPGGDRGGSTDAHERFLTYWRGEIAIALLGANSSVEQDSTNANARAGLDVAEDIRDGDARIVEGVVNQVIRWTVAINWPKAVAPLWELRPQEEIDERQAKRDEILVRAGVKPTRAYWIRTYKFEDSDLEPEAPRPEPGTPVLQSVTAASAAPAAPGSGASATPIALAAPADLPQDWAQAQVERLSGALEKAVRADWLPVIRAELDRYIADDRSPADFAARLLELLPSLPADQFAGAMGEALGAAELAGRYDVSRGA